MTLFYFNALHMDDCDETWTVGVHMYRPCMRSPAPAAAEQPSLEHTPVLHCCLLFRAAGL